MNLDCLGVVDPTVSGAVDLPSYFGTLWRSTILARAFRALVANDGNLAEKQFLTELQVTMNAVTSTAALFPALGFIAVAVAGINVPFLQIAGPGAAGTFRIDIQFRHSLLR